MGVASCRDFASLMESLVADLVYFKEGISVLTIEISHHYRTFAYNLKKFTLPLQ
jgi:hypothetical protein